MTGYWPWWAGALALGAIAVAHARLTGRPLGVSGSLGKVARAGETREGDRVAETLLSDQAALEAALLAATADAFGDDRARAGHEAEARTPVETPPGAPLAGHAAFLAMMIVGALVAAFARGAFHPSASLGTAHEQLFGRGAAMLAVLAGGGVLVGFGTRMAGGCTSGHGLSGCARLVPASLVATATFLGGAIATSFVLAAVLR